MQTKLNVIQSTFMKNNQSFIMIISSCFVMMVLFVMPACQPDEILERVQVGDLYYNLNATRGLAEVTWMSNSDVAINSNYPNLIDLEIPQTIDYQGKTYTVKAIEDMAFGYNYSIQSVTIPGSIKKIKGNPFAHCYKLRSITVSQDNTVYDSRENCNAIIVKSSNTLIAGCNETVIPASVKHIGPSAMVYFDSLTTVTLPEGLETIGEYAFTGSGLTQITIPNSVNSLSTGAFSHCELQSVTIGNGIKWIGDNAFYGCLSLRSIQMGDNVEVIGESAFANLPITTIELPNSLKSIEGYAFDDCSKLKSIVIPTNVTKIERYAFGSCTALKSFTNQATKPQQIVQTTFYNINLSGCTLYVPQESLSEYRQAAIWRTFGTITPY